MNDKAIKEKCAKDAIAIASLSGTEPSDYAKNLLKQVVEGKITSDEMNSLILKHYT